MTAPIIGVLIILIATTYIWVGQRAAGIRALKAEREAGTLTPQLERGQVKGLEAKTGPGGGFLLIPALQREHGALTASVSAGIAGMLLGLHAATWGGAVVPQDPLFILAILMGLYALGFGLRFWALRGIKVEVDRAPLRPGDSAKVRVFLPGAKGEAQIKLAVLHRERERRVYLRGQPWKSKLLSRQFIREREPAAVRADGLVCEVDFAIPPEANPSYESRDFQVQWGVQVYCEVPGRLPVEELFLFRVVGQ